MITFPGIPVAALQKLAEQLIASSYLKDGTVPVAFTNAAGDAVPSAMVRELDIQIRIRQGTAILMVKPVGFAQLQHVEAVIDPSLLDGILV